MRKTSVIVISVIIIFGVILIGCVPAQDSTTKIAAPPTSTYSPLPVVVSPFYDSQSNQINVGNYSQQLSTSDFQELTTLVQEMEKQRDVLTPEQMFVLAIKLFDLGDNDNAVYWFYEAQFRAKLFLIAIDPSQVGSIGDPSFELPAAYNGFTQLTTEFINGYAGCDIENWVKIATTVKNDNPKPPELDKLFPGVVFVASSQWQMLNDQVAGGLDALISYLMENKETIKQQRKNNNTDARFCS
jgi:hypothetical protein